MPDNVALLQIIHRWIDTASRCMTSPMSMPACKPFLEYVLYASAGIATVLLLWTDWKMVDYIVLQLATQACIAGQTAAPWHSITLHTEVRDAKGNLLAGGDFKSIPLPPQKFLELTGMRALPANWQARFYKP